LKAVRLCHANSRVRRSYRHVMIDIALYMKSRPGVIVVNRLAVTMSL
jgi:hypothetical protein